MKIVTLRRYPVKSMLGETLGSATITGSGLEGDRGLALLDPGTGKIVSAKNPRLWRDMLTFSADGYPDVMIRFPDGSVVPAKPSAALDALLSRVLGREVTLVSVPPPGATLDRSRPEEVLRDGINAVTKMDVVTLPGITFHDFANIHLITTATLQALGTEPERYRPNLVISAPDADGGAAAGVAFAENEWLGKLVRIGSDVLLRIIARTPRCAVPTLRHGTLDRNVDALRIPAARNRVIPIEGMSPEPCVGVYAQVIRPGLVSVGDQVDVIKIM